MNELKKLCKDNSIKFPKILYTQLSYYEWFAHAIIFSTEFKGDICPARKLAKENLCKKIYDALYLDIKECNEQAY